MHHHENVFFAQRPLIISLHSSTPFDADSSIPTVYDETYRGKSFAQPTILTVAEGFEAHMSGRLEHHAYGTDGSFQISLAGGEGTYISQVRDFIFYNRHKNQIEI